MTGLRCPTCGDLVSHIIDRRPADAGFRRRRRCANGHRFTTIEVAVSDKPRTLTGMRLTTPSLDKQKLIQRVVAELEKSL